MNRLLAILVLVTGLGMAEASDGTDYSYEPVSVADIILLTQSGVSEATILVFLQNRELSFVPDADDIDSLLRAGVSEAVIRYLIQQTAPAPIYTNVPKIYVDPYPVYYYRPYYTRPSLYYGFSIFPHLSFGHNRHIPVHHDRPHHTSSLLLAHNDHGVFGASHNNRYSVPHTGGNRSGPGFVSARHDVSGAGIRLASAGHNRPGIISQSSRSAGHNRSGIISHGSRSAGRLNLRSAGHSRSGSIGHASRSAGRLNLRSAGHSRSGSISHGSRSAVRSAGHSRSGSIGYQRGGGGHRGSSGGGHRGGGGHGGGGHG